MKYYVIKTTVHGVEYKRYKCVDGWTKDKSKCWQFTEKGAQKIADRLNDRSLQPRREHYNILKAE